MMLLDINPDEYIRQALKNYIKNLESSTGALAKVKDLMIKETLIYTYGNQSKAAKLLGMHDSTLSVYLNKK